MEQQLGPIDVWVNCAMNSVFSPFKEMELDDFRPVTEVTYLGFVYGTKAALRRMLPRDEGSIVQVVSALAYRGIPLQSAYCGAKHAIQGFTESVRTELLHDKSRVRITIELDLCLSRVVLTTSNWAVLSPGSALGPDKVAVRSVASNAGHLLATGIAPLDKGRQVARRLMKPDCFSGWGIRTLSSGHPSYNPFSYHLGSVWPVENGTFAYGFARYGCTAELHRLAEGFFASTDLFAGNRLPEALGGIARDTDHAHPGFYPEANDPHGWSTSSVVLTLHALLGLRLLAPLGLLVVNPQLPPWLPDLELHGVRVGDATVDLRF